MFWGSSLLCAAAREKDHAHAVLSSVGQRDVRLRAGGAQECVRDLEEDARAVAGPGVAAYGAPVLEVLEEQQRVAHDVMGSRAPEMRHETHAAPVVLMGRVVQPLRGGQSRDVYWRSSGHTQSLCEPRVLP